MSNLAKLKDYLTSIENPPIEVIPLAKSFDINIYQVDGWEDRISGMIKKSKEDGGASGYAIYVNINHNEKRKRFTIAHELAHYILHENLIGDGVVDDGLYRSGLSNLIEKEANNLAARILMPETLLRRLVNDKENYDIERLAEKFNVSQQAMAIRLRIAQII